MPRTAPPGNPRGCPFRSRNPHPPLVSDPCPASIVIHRPAVRFLGLPSPASIGIGPTTITIRPPIFVRIARLPAVAIVADFYPVAIVAELIVEKVHGDAPLRLGFRKADLDSECDREKKKRLLHRDEGLSLTPISSLLRSVVPPFSSFFGNVQIFDKRCRSFTIGAKRSPPRVSLHTGAVFSHD